MVLNGTNKFHLDQQILVLRNRPFWQHSRSSSSCSSSSSGNCVLEELPVINKMSFYITQTMYYKPLNLLLEQVFCHQPFLVWCGSGLVQQPNECTVEHLIETRFKLFHFRDVTSTVRMQVIPFLQLTKHQTPSSVSSFQLLWAHQGSVMVPHNKQLNIN